MTTQTPSPTARREQLDFLGSRARILATAEPGTDAAGLVEMLEVPAGQMPPLHVHHAEDEGFYVLEGEVTLFMPGRELTLSAGEFFLAPRGVPHTYRVGEQPASWLVLSSPAGFERFVADAAALEEADPAALAEVAARHRIEILGPPGAMP
jgi:quercetin dioxygenase-like cupin family protein